MGFINTEQTVEIIEAVSEAINTAPVPTPVPVVVPPDQPWWQIFAIVGGTVAALLTAWGGLHLNNKRKKK